MALDEATLELADPDACYLRLYRWPRRDLQAVTFGFSQSYEAAVCAARRKTQSITFPLIRRPTGGGIVYHDGDITFSFVFPWPRLVAPSLMYKNIHLGAHLGLKAHSLASRLWSPEIKPPAGVREECFLQAEPMDLTHEDGRKCLGGALRRRSGKGLYQGSLRPEGFGSGARRLHRALVDGLGLQWGVLFCSEAPQAAVADRASRLAFERYRTDRWNKRR